MLLPRVVYRNMSRNLSQILPDNDDRDFLKTPLLKIRGKTMFFGNVIYQINNISSIGFVDLTTTTKISNYNAPGREIIILYQKLHAWAYHSRQSRSS